MSTLMMRDKKQKRWVTFQETSASLKLSDKKIKKMLCCSFALIIINYYVFTDL